MGIQSTDTLWNFACLGLSGLRTAKEVCGVPCRCTSNFNEWRCSAGRIDWWESYEVVIDFDCARSLIGFSPRLTPFAPLSREKHGLVVGLRITEINW